MILGSNQYFCCELVILTPQILSESSSKMTSLQGYLSNVQEGWDDYDGEELARYVQL